MRIILEITLKFFIKIFIAGLCGLFSFVHGRIEWHIPKRRSGFLAVSQAKPNIFFILDDSGSMQSSALGDEVTVSMGIRTRLGIAAACATRATMTQRLFIQCQSSLMGLIFLSSNSHKRFITVLTQLVSPVNLSIEFMPWRTSLTNPALPANTQSIRYRPDCIAPSGFSCVVDPNTPFPNRAEAAHYFVYTGDKRSNLGDNSVDDHCKDILHDREHQRLS